MSSKYFRKTRHVLPCQHIRGYAHSTADEQEGVLHMAINQYTPLDNASPQPGDVTIIAAHANGVPKELYEPLWTELYHASAATRSFRIRGIWMADVSFQGESGVLNEGKLGNDPSWTDHPRDLLHMTNHFRAGMPRPLVALGHSMGGHNIASLSLLHPRLLDALVLIDPVMMRAATRRGHFAEARASTFRRDLWPSRAAAAAAFRKNPFYAQWDPRVLDLWLQHGLRDLPTLVHPSLDAAAVPAATDKKSAINTLASAAAGVIPPVPAPSPLATPVTLTTPKHLEVFTFARPNYPASRSSPSVAPTPSRVTHPDLPDTSMAGADALHPFYRPEPMALFAQLPQLRPRCLYVFAEESHLSAPQHVADKLAVTGVGAGGSGGVREGAVQHVVMKKAGHFVPFERPRDVAELMERFVAREMVRWRREEQELAREWRARSQRDKVVVDEEWLYWMGTLGKPKI